MAMDIKAMLEGGDVLSVMRAFSVSKRAFRTPSEVAARDYDPALHRINDRNYRKDKTVRVPLEGRFDEMGQQVYTTRKVRRCRVAVPMQRVLVERSVGFLLGNPVEYQCNGPMSQAQESLFNAVKGVLKGNKMEYNDKRIARTLFSERECAEIWYIVPGADGRPRDVRMRIVSPSRGDGLYPHFDSYDRMDAFARSYSDEDAGGRMVSHFDVYDGTSVYRYADGGGGWALLEPPRRHGFTKIPVVYYRQEEAEWECVQPIIERIEDLLSNWGDTNDYFGSPSYFVSGAIQGFADKGEQGRVYQGTDGAEMRVLSWDSSPQSISEELANLTNIVFSYTQTPDVSFETMKRLGGNTSGVAIRLMFTDPHMKASVKIETFGEMFTRRVNIIKDGLATSVIAVPSAEADSLNIEPKFTPFAPKNEGEIVQTLSAATGGKPSMSQEDAVRLNPLVGNAERTLSALADEARAEEEAEKADEKTDGKAEK